jgi:DNA replication protein DnaC
MTVEIPQRFAEATYDKVPQHIKDIFEKMRESRKGIYLHGGVGTGKTFIAYALLREWEDQRSKENEQRDQAVQESIKSGVVSDTAKVRVPAVFWNSTRLLFDLRSEFKRNSEETSKELIERNNLLFLDDLGAEKVTEWVEEVMYLTVNTRYERNVPMIITSNLPLSGYC